MVAVAVAAPQRSLIRSLKSILVVVNAELRVWKSQTLSKYINRVNAELLEPKR